jgi:PleD family two-component response regulator
LIQSENSLLLVDPYQNLLHAYRILFEEVGLPVETAANLEEAQGSLKDKEYALVMAELFLPDHKGLDFWQETKISYPETYLILMTDAQVDEEGYERIFNSGADDLIIKPFPPKKLLVHVRRGLQQRASILREKKMAQLALLDPICESQDLAILNHDYFKQCFRRELKRARRHQDPLSLMIIKAGTMEAEKDGKKNFLTELAQLLRRSTREEDVIGRENGGLGILLYKTGHEGSRVLEQRLSDLIQNHRPFQSERLQSLVDNLQIQSFSYPEQWKVPEPFSRIAGDLIQGIPFH